MKKIIYTKKTPDPIGPYSQAVEINGMIFCSGQIAINPLTGEMQQQDIKVETMQVMENIKNLLAAADTDFSKVIKTSIFLSDMNLFGQVNEIYGSYFKENFPARETVAVSGLPKGANVEISVIVAK